MKPMSRRDFFKGASASAVTLAATGILAGCTASTASKAGTYIPGTYSATSLGMDTITVTMIFEAESIVDVQLDVKGETDTIGQAAAPVLRQAVLDKQSAEIDGVSGASITSDAVKKAVAACIAQAKGESVVIPEGAPVSEGDLPPGITAAELQASTCELGEITGAEDGGTYDVIVIGAGTSGVPCALKAAEDGAKVLVLQKEDGVVAQGNTCTGIIPGESNAPAMLQLEQETAVSCNYRSDRDQVRVYVQNSGEAVQWYYDTAIASGYPATIAPAVFDYGSPFGAYKKISVRSAGKPDNTGTVLASILKANATKLDVRYSTPAVQLIKEGGKVTGVYAKDKSGKYYRFTAAKGVVLATGDYQNNDAMVAKYCPDVKDFHKKQFHKTGDGILMGIAAGGTIEPIGHTKMIHDFDSGTMFDEPFLRVDMYGKRFHNEDVDMSYANNYMRHYDKENTGKYCQIFDDNYEAQVTGWGGRPTPKAGMQVYMPEVDVERKGVTAELIATYRANTLDELATKLGIPADKLKKSVDRYNELVDLGYDADFGKNPKFMKKIETAPYWGIKKNLRVSALCSGININSDFQALDESRNPVEGLYAIGNCSGQFYGSPDYPLHLAGLSIGRCVTAGYVLGKTLAVK
ncbi:FAD-dependent oxidoreductase [Desulfitobacterium sp. THU1]|uniref:FAD-dependent oxidoreductase n=1 Tax=Desulfitobacterium sp. THU1 TaxID=3138072 RepID=UPI00311FCED4